MENLEQSNTYLTDLYLYKYHCKKWWGQTQNVRYLQVPHSQKKEISIYDEALKDAKIISGSNLCDVSILQKFSVSIKPLEMFTPTHKMLSLTQTIIKTPDKKNTNTSTSTSDKLC